MEEEVTMTSSAGSNEVKEKSKTPKRRKPRKQKAGQGVKGRRKTVAAGMGHEIGISDDNGTSRGFETEMEVVPHLHLSNIRNCILTRGAKTSILRPPWLPLLKAMYGQPVQLVLFLALPQWYTVPNTI